MYGELSDLDPRRRTLLERLHANSGVDTRHTVLPLAEYGRLDGFGPTNDLYIDRATALGEQAMRGALLDAGMDASERGPADRHVGHRPRRAVAGCPAHPAAGPARRHQAHADLRPGLRGRRGRPRAAARLPARLAAAHGRAAGRRTVLADRPGRRRDHARTWSSAASSATGRRRWSREASQAAAASGRPAGHRHPQRGRIPTAPTCSGWRLDIGRLPHRAHRRPGRRGREPSRRQASATSWPNTG